MSWYKVNRPDVVCEAFEDEVVVVNLRSGAYYSLGGSAVSVWNLVEGGAGPASIAETLASAHGRQPESVRPDVERFLAELLQEQLIAPDGDGPQTIGQRREPSEPADQPVTPYVAPSLEKYTDMQELLLLDPIHEVDETGWPARPPQAPGT